MKVGNVVRIKKDAIENGLLKERCQKILPYDGIVVRTEGVTLKGDEVSVNFRDGFNAWIMPVESLEIVSEKKHINLTPDQVKQAKALYIHLLNHIEVMDNPKYRGMPICKICDKSAYQIYAEEGEPPIQKR